MTEKLLKYTCDGARIHVVFLNEAVKIGRAHV